MSEMYPHKISCRVRDVMWQSWVLIRQMWHHLWQWALKLWSTNMKYVVWIVNIDVWSVKIEMQRYTNKNMPPTQSLRNRTCVAWNSLATLCCLIVWSVCCCWTWFAWIMEHAKSVRRKVLSELLEFCTTQRWRICCTTNRKKTQLAATISVNLHLLSDSTLQLFEQKK